MKKFNLSLVAVLAMSTFAIAGGDIAPVEPMIETPMVCEVEESTSAFYVGAGYSYFDGSIGDVDVTAHGMLGLAGYKFNEYVAIEGRYTGTLSDMNFDGGSYNDVDRDKLLTNKAIYLKVMYPMNDIAVYGLLGYGQTVANNTSDEGFQYGVGGSYNVTDNVGLFVDYTRLYDDSGLDTGTNDYTMDTVNVGLTYAF